jgi:hypothetical protein
MRIVALMVALVAVAGMPSAPSNRPKASTQDAEEIWRLTLPEAIRIGLDNSEVVRVISTGATLIPLGDFKPTPPGEQGPLDSVYDESITAEASRPGRP